VNYHGPYILTRLLEPVLIASKPSRVVNVASVEHRIGYIKDIRKFMFDAKKFLYSETKLGNVLLTYEHQRRLGSFGVQVCLYFCFNLVVIGLMYKAYPDDCQHRLQVLLRLRPYPVRGHRLLCVSLFQHCNGIYISAVAHGCVPMPILQWHLHICSGSHVCLPVLPLLPTSTALLSTSTVFVVYQYCLCCLPVLPCCLPILALLSTSTAFLSATGPRYAALLHGNS